MRYIQSYILIGLSIKSEDIHLPQKKKIKRLLNKHTKDPIKQKEKSKGHLKELDATKDLKGKPRQANPLYMCPSITSLMLLGTLVSSTSTHNVVHYLSKN